MNDRCSSFRVPVRIAVVVASFLPAWAAPAQVPGPEPLTVRRAAELALQRAPELAAVRAAHESDRASADVARDAFHPSAWLTTSPGYTYGFPGQVAGRVPSVAGVEVRTAIYDTARRSDALEKQANASSREGELGRTCQETVERAITAYARCWVDQSLADVAQRRLDAAEAIRKREEALAAEGRRTELDAERAKLESARAKQKLLNAESDRDLDMLELKRLIGWPGSAPLVLAGDPESSIPDLPAAENLVAARAADPELQALSREIELLGRAASLQAKRWAPVIEASAQYQRLARYNDWDKYYLTFTPDSVAVGVSIAIPLWTGGRQTDLARRARARLDNAEARRAARESDLEMAVKRAEAGVSRTTAERSLSRRSQGIAEQSLDAEQLLVREGRSELAELDERQIALADADEESARVSLGSLLERVRLLSLRGDLNRALLGVDPPCPAR